MPTGYTAGVQEGASFKEFVMCCARAMGACVNMRDEPLGAPIPERFEPSTYHAEALAKSRAALEWLEQMPLSEAGREANREFKERLDAHTARLARKFETRRRYEAMLTRVNAWTPPTEDHVGLKEFMLSQLNDSLSFDCGLNEKEIAAPICLSAGDWVLQQIDRERKNIEYHQAKYQEEVERVESRNAWLRALRESLMADPGGAA